MMPLWVWSGGGVHSTVKLCVVISSTCTEAGGEDGAVCVCVGGGGGDIIHRAYLANKAITGFHTGFFEKETIWHPHLPGNSAYYQCFDS